MAEARLKSKLTMDDAGFHAGIRKAVAAAGRASQKIGAAMKALGTAGLVAFTAAMIAATVAMSAGVMKAFDLGGAMADLSARTGAAAGQLAIITQALDDAGVGADKAGPAINKMQKAIVALGKGDGAAKKAFGEIGLGYQELKRLAPEEQFKLIGSELAKISDPAEQAAAAMAIFGKSGGELLQVFNDPAAFTNAAKVLGGAADILNRRASDFDAASDSLSNIGKKFTGFFVGVGDSIVDALNPILDKIVSYDFSVIGQKVGAALLSGASALAQMLEFAVGSSMAIFTEPSKGLAVFGAYLKFTFLANTSLFLKGMVTGVKNALTFFSEGLPALGAFLLEKVTAIGPVVGAFLKNNAILFVTTIYDGFVRIAAFFGGSIRTAMDGILSTIGKVDKLNVTGFKDYQGAGFATNVENEEKTIRGGMGGIDSFIMGKKLEAEKALDQAIAGATEAGSGVLEKIKEILPSILDGTALDSAVTDARDALTSKIDEMANSGKLKITAIFQNLFAAFNGLANTTATAATNTQLAVASNKGLRSSTRIGRQTRATEIKGASYSSVNSTEMANSSSGWSNLQNKTSNWSQLQSGKSAWQKLQEKPSIMLSPSEMKDGKRRPMEGDSKKAEAESAAQKALKDQAATAQGVAGLLSILQGWEGARA